MSREVRSYSDVARRNIERPLGKIDSYFPILSITSRYIFTELCRGLPGCINLLNGIYGPSVTSFINIIQEINAKSLTHGNMGKLEVKNKERAPQGENRKGRGFTSGHAVRREAFTRTIKALSMLQVKFNCGEGNEEGRFLECMRVKIKYLRTKLEFDGNIKTSIRNGEVFKPARPNPVPPQKLQRKCYRRIM